MQQDIEQKRSTMEDLQQRKSANDVSVSRLFVVQHTEISYSCSKSVSRSWRRYTTRPRQLHVHTLRASTAARGPFPLPVRMEMLVRKCLKLRGRASIVPEYEGTRQRRLHEHTKMIAGLDSGFGKAKEANDTLYATFQFLYCSITHLRVLHYPLLLNLIPMNNVDPYFENSMSVTQGV